LQKIVNWADQLKVEFGLPGWVQSKRTDTSKQGSLHSTAHTNQVNQKKSCKEKSDLPLPIRPTLRKNSLKQPPVRLRKHRLPPCHNPLSGGNGLIHPV